MGEKDCKGAFIVWDSKNVRQSKKNLYYDVTPASDQSLNNVEEFERGRKRKRQDENWERSKKKKLRNTGEASSAYSVSQWCTILKGLCTFCKKHEIFHRPTLDLNKRF